MAKGGADKLKSLGLLLSGYGSAISGNPMYLQQSLLMQQLARQNKEQEDAARQKQVQTMAANSLMNTMGAEGTPETKQFSVNGKTYGQNAAATPLVSPKSQERLFARMMPDAFMSAQGKRIFDTLYPQGFSGTLGEGQVAYQNGNIVARGPAKSNEFEGTNMQLPGTDNIGYAGTKSEFDQMISRGYRPIGKTVPGAPTAPKNKDPQDLRKEFLNVNKDFIQIRDAYGRIVSSAQNPSAAGDLALIFNYMKILDPDSTVREGEFANAENAGGIDSRTRAWYNKVARGERLSAQQRADFLSRSTDLYGSQEKFYQSSVERYSELARRAKLDPRDVVTDLTAGLGQMPKPPAVGDVVDGYRFLGGNPALEASWVEVK